MMKTRNIVFLEFATWSIVLKLPPPWSPPTLIHISLDGVVPCQFVVLVILVQHWFDKVRNVSNIRYWWFSHVFSVLTVPRQIYVFFTLNINAAVFKNIFVFWAGSSLDHMLFSWLGPLFPTRLCSPLPQVTLFFSVLLLYLCVLLLDFVFYWPPRYVHPNFIHQCSSSFAHSWGHGCRCLSWFHHFLKDERLVPGLAFQSVCHLTAPPSFILDVCVISLLFFCQGQSLTVDWTKRKIFLMEKLHSLQTFLCWEVFFGQCSAFFNFFMGDVCTCDETRCLWMYVCTAFLVSMCGKCRVCAHVMFSYCTAVSFTVCF